MTQPAFPHLNETVNDQAREALRELSIRAAVDAAVQVIAETAFDDHHKQLMILAVAQRLALKGMSGQ